MRFDRICNAERSRTQNASRLSSKLKNGLGPRHPLFGFPQTLGNHAVLSLLESGQVDLSQFDDRFEKEAVRAAHQVMRLPNAYAKNNGASRRTATRPQRTTNEMNTAGILRDSGKPIPEFLRNFFEPRFGHDFSDVRVHTDSGAAASAEALNARAYTVGRNVVFGKGQYAPRTESGNRLLAHELTHVLQGRLGGRFGDNGSVIHRQALPAQHGISVDQNLDRWAALRERFFALEDEASFHRRRLRRLQVQLRKEMMTSRQYSKQLEEVTKSLSEEGSEAITAAIAGIASTFLGGFGSGVGSTSKAGQLVQGGASLGGFGVIVAELTADAFIDEPKVSWNALEAVVGTGTILGGPAGIILDKVAGNGPGVLIAGGMALINLEVQAFQFFQRAKEHEAIIEHLGFISESMAKDIALAYESEEKLVSVAEEMLKTAFELQRTEA